MAGIGFLLLLLGVAIAAPLIERYPPEEMAFEPLVGPTSEHWFGTDELGRDLWSRVVWGARISLGVGVGSQMIALAIGVTVGSVAGFFGGWTDIIAMRMTDIFQALPSILLALLFLTVLGSSTGVLVLAIGLSTKGRGKQVGKPLRRRLAEAVTADNLSDGVPAGFTYLRQFLDHDLTFDKTGVMEGIDVAPESIERAGPRQFGSRLPRWRRPAGSGSARFYESDRLHLKMGNADGGPPTTGFDLPRHGSGPNPREAVIPTRSTTRASRSHRHTWRSSGSTTGSSKPSRPRFRRHCGSPKPSRS